MKPEQILQEFQKRIEESYQKGNQGRRSINIHTPRGSFNAGLDKGFDILADILEVCPVCLGEGKVEIQTAPDESHFRACECQSEDDFSGASEGDR